MSELPVELCRDDAYYEHAYQPPGVDARRLRRSRSLQELLRATASRSAAIHRISPRVDRSARLATLGAFAFLGLSRILDNHFCGAQYAPLRRLWGRTST
jgi:hypothetical protein